MTNRLRKIKYHKWYAWIPTNLGILNYDFITKKQISSNFGNKIGYSEDDDTKRFFNLILKNFRDSLPSYFRVSEGKEITPIGSITIKLLSQNLIGVIQINYPNHLTINFKYKLNENGKIFISDPMFGHSTKFFIDEDILNTFAQMAYMIVKQCVHGDSHHHQKIDYIITVHRDKFPVNEIIYTFGRHIKNVERDIKSLNTCTGHLKAINAIAEVKGYISYVNTFYELNKNIVSNKSKTLIKNMENVVTSLESTVTKKDNHFKYSDNAKTTLLSIFTIIISLSLFGFKILMDNHDKSIPLNSFNNIVIFPWYYILIGIVIFALIIFFIIRRCYIQSYIFYNYYSLYEQYKYLSWLNPKDASFKHILFKLIIPIGIIIISFYYIF